MTEKFKEGIRNGALSVALLVGGGGGIYGGEKLNEVLTEVRALAIADARRDAAIEALGVRVDELEQLHPRSTKGARHE